MPRNSRSDASDSENDAPESIPLSQSKKDTQRLEAERRNAQGIQRKVKREKNRETDRKLKERAVMNKRGKGSVVDKIKGGGNVVERKTRRKVNEEEEEDDEQDDLEKRMQRAMKEAEEESDLESDGEEFMGINKDEKANDDETTVGHPDHLPDELFAAAFRSLSKRKKFGEDANPTPPAKKRKNSSKDIIVGSRAIRILPSSSAPPVPSTIPSKKINKFLDRSLALKTNKHNLRTKGWERRPVNIGLLKRDGPPISFVRNK